MRDIDTISSSVLEPLLQSGFRTSRHGECALARAGLPLTILNGGSFEVPRNAMCRATQNLNREEASPTYVFDSVLQSPEQSDPIPNPVHREPSVPPIAALCAYADHCNSMVSVIDFWWEVDDGYFWFKRSSRYCIDPFELDTELYALAFFLRFVKSMVSHDWAPAIVTLRSTKPRAFPGLANLEANRIFDNQCASSVALPLDRLIPNGAGSIENWKRERWGGTSRVVSPAFQAERLREAISLYVAAGVTSLSSVAASFGVSSRTLQRKLSQLGLQFRPMVNELQMELACARLHETSLSVREISDSLGYSHHGDFTRAFRKALNMTPSDYRNLHRVQR